MKNKMVLKGIGQYSLSILIAVVLAFVFHTYVFARSDVTGPSMQPTFHNNDIIFQERISTAIGKINRGEIVVFNSKDENNSNYIKRVIGIEGDTVDIKNGRVYLNGKCLEESYLPKGTVTEPNSYTTQYIIPKGYIFVLGDNRGNSTDSRILGPINIKDVKGHVIFRVYPFKNMEIF
ncbi:signal peptidase I [Clostridium tyrobutyricum]|uniref:signal peptidase I n=1 Tax=Clostridium tyrobutyricum TaxID=1519 RepID=UPI001C38F86C|nr:signal peptidase I [Clostridium tyrobutyricum]MBV4418851.1 signal peptidase I [Clostridium tyrobutyricum]